MLDAHSRATLAPTAQLRRRRLFGLDFVDAADERAVLVDILMRAEDDDGLAPIVVTPNVDHLVRLDDVAADVRNVVLIARWCLPDGQPLVWTSKLAGRPLAARLTGSSLVERFWEDERGRVPFAVVASSNLIAERVRAAEPEACVVVAPALDHRVAVECFVAQHLDAIVASKPQLLFIGVGFPKDHEIIATMMRSWPRDRAIPVMLAVGGSFEMLFGIRRRAPEWVQRAGLEWLYRFGQEPRRLFVRYFVRDPWFLGRAVSEVRRARAERRRTGAVA